MAENADYIELVKQAQLGNRESLETLAAAVRERLREHVYRITLQSNLTQDIVQESLLEMYKIIDKLKRADKFWPWLCGIAFNKIRRHQRQLRGKKTISLDEIEQDRLGKDRQDGLAKLISEELQQIVLSSMNNLKPRHRLILTMKCYDEMEYSDIADSLGCSEFAARMLFYRAKKNLSKQLSRNGLSKGAMLMVLTLFAKMTAQSKAAAMGVSISAETLNTGFAVSALGLASSKATIATLTAAGIVTVATITTPSHTTKEVVMPPSKEAVITPAPVESQFEGIEQCWYYYPEGINGPVMMRVTRNEDKESQPYCHWLQNDLGNYYSDKGGNIIYMTNHRTWNHDLTIRQLPTDNSQLTDFIEEVQGYKHNMEYLSAKGNALLIVAQHEGRKGNGFWRIIRHYNVLEEDYFRGDWQSNATIIDERDVIHKQGWAYFKIEGEINNQAITGTGQIPLIYSVRQQLKPWLMLEVKDSIKIIDAGDKAYILGKDETILSSYPSETFFKGLARPWMGLHTIDIIRRDAAENRLRFDTKLYKDTRISEVSIQSEQGKLIYTIDMERDLIDKIVYERNGTIGQMTFSYTDEVNDIDNKIDSSGTGINKAPLCQEPGMMWLMQLAESSIDK